MTMPTFDNVNLAQYKNIEERVVAYRHKLANELEEMVADNILEKDMTLEQIVKVLKYTPDKEIK